MTRARRLARRAAIACAPFVYGAIGGLIIEAPIVLWWLGVLP